MDLRPYFIKLKLKSRELGKRFRLPVKPPTLNKFYSRYWHGHLPGIEYFADRTLPKFFFSPKDLHKYQKALKARFPDSCRKIAKRANSVVAHRFDLLGSGDVFLGDHIDWHIDFKSGKRWEKLPFAQTKIVDPNDNSDIKIPWELSRLQFLADLGRGYVLHENPIYKREFLQILEDWEKANPVDLGVNWVCSMEVAIRVINIIWGLHFFRYDNDDDLFIKRIIRLLYYHALHIEKNLEVISAGANSNHLVSDYLGLFYIGLLFPEFDRAAKWQKIGKEGLEATIREQIHPDGADYECSTSYHRLVLEMFISAFILGRINGVRFSNTFKERLYSMIHFSEAITPRSGFAPLIGDNDDGFIVKLSSDNPADHRSWVDIGLLLFGERVPKDIPISEERLWYLGPDSLVLFISSQPPKSQLFKDSGYAVIRNDDFHLVFNAAGIPPKNFGGHKHNDLLSFTLEIDGIPYLVDPGTYCYSANYHLRNLSRSTGLHNTVEIDSLEQNRFFDNRLFYLVRDAIPKINLWTDLGNSIVVSASHNGYARLDDKIIHKRTLSISLENSSILMADEFDGKKGGTHTFLLRFITPFGAKKIDSGTVVISKERFKSLVIKTSEDNLEKLNIAQESYFPHYGRKAPAKLIEFSYKAALPFKIETIIIPSGRFLQAHEQIRLIEPSIRQFREKAELAR
jgi:hypothetical protein